MQFKDAGYFCRHAATMLSSVEESNSLSISENAQIGRVAQRNFFQLCNKSHTPSASIHCELFLAAHLEAASDQAPD